MLNIKAGDVFLQSFYWNFFQRPIITCGVNCLVTQEVENSPIIIYTKKEEVTRR
jgi:hypothetical protein